MKLVHHKKFTKAYANLDRTLQSKIDVVIGLFQIDPTNRILENHALQGKLLGRRAIKVTGDVRIVFREIDDYMLVILLDVGTHNQVY